MAWRGEALTREAGALAQTAMSLGRHARRGKRNRTLPTLWFVTDPGRTPDPVSIARRLPRGAGVIYRAFGAPDARIVGRALAKLARRRGLVLLVGADEALAQAVGAHGVHLPERRMASAPRLRAGHPRWIVTTAAHSAGALARAGRLGLDAAFVSAVFPSRSPSAGRPLGPIRLARLVGGSRLPVIALGGVNSRTAPRLRGTGVAGLAAVEAFVSRATPQMLWWDEIGPPHPVEMA